MNTIVIEHTQSLLLASPLPAKISAGYFRPDDTQPILFVFPVCLHEIGQRNDGDGNPNAGFDIALSRSETGNEPCPCAGCINYPQPNSRDWKAEGVDQMSLDSYSPPLAIWRRSTGQALVEFTLTFMLLLVVAWLPADFGLAFYTGQLAQNAAREGARIAAADSTLASGSASCVMPSCTGNIFKETAARISSALLPAATITVNLDPDTGANCNRMVTVTVSGTYNFFFYQLLRWFGASGNLNNTPISRQTRMRWEGQAGC